MNREHNHLEGWELFRRIREIDSALQLNVIRLIGIIVFFAIHLANYMTVDNPSSHYQEFHESSIWLTVAWLFMTVAVFLAYFSQRIPWYAKYCSTIADIGLLTAMAAIGEKADASIIVIYFVIISTSLLRFSKMLILVTTIGCLAGFLTLVGLTDQTWFDARHDVPVTKTLITSAAILLNGFVCWRICSSVQHWIENKGPRMDHMIGKE